MNTQVRRYWIPAKALSTLGWSEGDVELVQAKDFDALREELATVRALLRVMTNEYACCLEAGFDRITFLGGDCDSVWKMLNDNPNYAKAIAALNPQPEATAHDA